MPLSTSITGIRGVYGDGLDPSVLTKYSSAFGVWCRKQSDSPKVVVGRDGRMTGDATARIVSGVLQAMGCDVVYLDIASTPTIQLATEEMGDGGIAVTASHNPVEWNALKLLNRDGEFLDPDQSAEVFNLADENSAVPAEFNAFGSYTTTQFLSQHIERITTLDFVDISAIDLYDFSVVVDGINSVGGVALPALLQALGLDDENIVCINCTPDGDFAHPPEPRKEHSQMLRKEVVEKKADIGFLVDPDGDRVAFVDETGSYVSEELTQVIIADAVWKHQSGCFVTNISASRTIDDVAEKHGEEVYRTPIGEAHVVAGMKKHNAIAGGEGTGSPIIPDLHYGRDALAATAIVLSYLATEEITLSALVEQYPKYYMVKDHIPREGIDVQTILDELERNNKTHLVNDSDGIKFSFEDSWVHIRSSTTEPIMRIYAEAPTSQKASELITTMKHQIKAVLD